MSCGFTLFLQVTLDGVKQPCSDASALSCRFHIEPVELHFGSIGNGIIADAADYPVIFIQSQPNISPLFRYFF